MNNHDFLNLLENMLCAGDHVSWHSALDGSESRLQHMLMAPDPQLGQLRSPTGMVTFVQASLFAVCQFEFHFNDLV